MKRIQIALVLFVAFCANPALTAEARNRKTLSSLQQALNEALHDDGPINLIQRKSLEGDSGTVVFMSRNKGMKRMITLARDGKDELSVMYLPRWQAWITESVERNVDGTRSDLRYRKAALISEPRVELWHSHSAKGIEASSSQRQREEYPLFWITPSVKDLFQLYGCAEINPKENFVGVIATPYGAMSFWSTEYRAMDTPFNPIFGDMIQRNYIEDVRKMQLAMRKAQPKDIAKLADAYRGIFFLRFEPSPDL